MQIHELNTFNGTPGGTDFLPLDSGFDTAKISAENLLKPLTEEEDRLDRDKVNLPKDENNDPDYGTAGQLLRTKGNSKTEWSNVGQPTDAQTAAAVSDWLNDHPEATTTVDYQVNTKTFDNVADMIADLTLSDGDKASTTGYYTVNDGGSGFYYITNTQPVDKYYETLTNGLYAVLIMKNGAYNALALGLKNDNTTDNAAKLNAIIREGIKIFFPAGVYRMSEVDINASSVSLIGEQGVYSAFKSGDDIPIGANLSYTEGTIFAPYGNQNYIIKGSTSIYHLTIDSITFTSMGKRSPYANDVSDLNAVTSALNLYKVRMSRLLNVNFVAILGCPLLITSSWEIDITNIDFRWIIANGTPNDHGCIEFTSVISNSAFENNSAINFINVNFERYLCHMIFAYDTDVRNINFGNTLVEQNYIYNSGSVLSWNYDGDGINAADPPEHELALVASKNCTDVGIAFAALNIDIIGNYYCIKDGVKWKFKAFTLAYDADSAFHVTIGTLHLEHIGPYCALYVGTSETYGAIKSLSIGSATEGRHFNKDRKFYPMYGTLTFFNAPFNILRRYASSNAVLPPRSEEIFPVPADDLGYIDAPNNGIIRFRRYIASPEYREHYAILSDDVYNANSDLGLSLPDSAIFNVFAMGISKITVVCKNGSSATLKITDFSGNTKVTGTKTSLNAYDIFTVDNTYTAGVSKVVFSSPKSEIIYGVIFSTLDSATFNQIIVGVSSTNDKTLYQLGIVPGKNGLYKVSLATGYSFAGTFSEYVIRVSNNGGTIDAVSPVVEGSNENAARVSASGVITPKSAAGPINYRCTSMWLGA